MQVKFRGSECKIGVADASDHSGISLKVHLNDRKINTIWRLNVGILNNEANVEQIRREIKRYIEENDNGEVNPAILWDGMKAVIRGKLIALTTSQKKARLALYKHKVEKLQGTGEEA